MSDTTHFNEQPDDDQKQQYFNYLKELDSPAMRRLASIQDTLKNMPRLNVEINISKNQLEVVYLNVKPIDRRYSPILSVEDRFIRMFGYHDNSTLRASTKRPTLDFQKYRQLEQIFGRLAELLIYEPYETKDRAYLRDFGSDTKSLPIVIVSAQDTQIHIRGYTQDVAINGNLRFNVNDYTEISEGEFVGSKLEIWLAGKKYMFVAENSEFRASGNVTST